MTKYLISFPSEAMVVTEVEVPGLSPPMLMPS